MPVKGKPGIYVPEVEVVDIGGNSDDVVIKQFPFTLSYKTTNKGKKDRSSERIEMKRPFKTSEIALGIAAVEKEHVENK